MTQAPRELTRRRSATAQIRELLLTHEGLWLHWKRFAQIAPCSWRTRISESRASFPDHVVEWNNRTERSAYRLRPKPLGRDAAVYRDVSLFDEPDRPFAR